MAGQEANTPRTTEALISRRGRDLAAIVLIGSGATGVLTTAWLYSLLAGAAVTSLLAVTLGIVIGME